MRVMGEPKVDGFIDRSKVRILLCDNDSKGAGEVFTLLCKCSYQVISVKSPRQVIDALNAEGPNIDIILSEIDLPMAKGLKMLKYIMSKGLQRIPVIMMSAQDEVTLVVKCLRLGAADYLVKPLRTNELLNLWTHMWRRRRMLGLTEKKMMNCEFDFDLALSDHSDVNTNSTMFSDDTEEKSRKAVNAEISLSIHHGNEVNAILAPGPADTQLVSLLNDRSGLPETNDHYQGQFTSGPKTSKLKIGQSSAFFTYVKSSKSTRTTPVALISVDETTPISRSHQEPSLCADVDSPPVNLFVQNFPQKSSPCGEPRIGDSQVDDFPSSNSFPDSASLNESSTPPLPAEYSHPNVSGYNPHSAYPYYVQGAMNQVMMTSPSSSSIFNNHANTAMMSQYNHVPHFPHHQMHGMAPFPYYPTVNLCLQPGQMPPHPWAAYGKGQSQSQSQSQSQTVDRREAALIKFRQKRKERCFDKKIRYVNRKKLAERRPRVKGQFVRKVNGIDVDLNGQPTSTDFDDEDEDEEED